MNGCAQSTDYLNTSFQMMVMSPAAEPSGCPYVTNMYMYVCMYVCIYVYIYTNLADLSHV